ncbi:MAG: outer membrane beta-barrel protein [Alphaproteobacteria bacterium]
MRSLKVALFAGAAIAAAFTSAQAADLGPIMQAPQPIQQVAIADTGGWYLRGDIGIGVQHFTEFDHTQTNSAFVWPASWRIDQRDMGDAVFLGAGIGYQWNSWLRFDATAEYRMKNSFKAIGSYTEFCPSGRCFDVYEGNHSAFVFMANGYIDLGTWMCLTPFVGAGVGVARHSITGLTDVGYVSGSTGFGYASNNDFAEWKFAWALHAGVAYNVSNNFKVELAYRYLNMGNVNTSIIDCASAGCSTGGGPRAFYTFTNMDSQDIKLGMRWMLTPDVVAPVYQPPLMRKG